MTNYKLGVLKGDGIGPEIVDATVEIFQAASLQNNVSITWLDLPMGFSAIEQHQDPLPELTVSALGQTDAWLLGPHDSAAYPEVYRKQLNPSGFLRHHFDLYANIRPTKSIPTIPAVIENADFIIFRENTEGFYADRNMHLGHGEWKITEDTVLTAGVFTKKAIRRIAHAACEMAMERKKKITIVHKANVLPMSMGMFLAECLSVAKQYPSLTVDDYHVDAMAAHLVRRAADFDVIVTENMYGDILSDLAGELAGSLGLAPSINTNEKVAMAQAAHGSAPDIAGLNISNPTGMILSTAMLFNWLAKKHQNEKLQQISQAVENALVKTLTNNIKTKDLGGTATTSEFTSTMIKNLTI